MQATDQSHPMWISARSLLDALRRLRSKAAISGFLQTLSSLEAERLIHDWLVWCRASQFPLTDDWRSWLLLGGRGAGKTRSGAEWVKLAALAPPSSAMSCGGRLALVGESYGDVRDVMIEGQSGLLAIHRRADRPKWTASLRRLEWPNGAVAHAFSSHDPEGLRGAQFGAAWCDEAGCPAVNKGANQPNVFPDPKSANAAIPHFSNGGRDDLIARRAVQAQLAYWDEANPDADTFNPASTVYSGRMVDAAMISPWAWDARPFPEFPNATDVWSDGGNWATGHWLNGRLGGCPLDDLVTAILADYGFADVDASGLDGIVDGYLVPASMSARAALEPLLAVHGAVSAEHDGLVRFRSLAHADEATVTAADWVDTEDAALVTRTRDHESDLPWEAVVNHGEIRATIDDVTSKSRRLETDSGRQIHMDVPAVLPAPLASTLADARLRERWVARQRLAFRLPLRHLGLAPGDVIEFTDDGEGKGAGRWQIAAIDDDFARSVEAVAVEAPASLSFQPAPVAGQPQPASGFGAPLVVLLDLPRNLSSPTHEPLLLTALNADPWAGSYLFASSSTDSGFQARFSSRRRAVIGELTQPLAAGPASRWDWANEVHVRLFHGQLDAKVRELVLNGANAAAIQTDEGGWEIVQFVDAQVVAEGEWRLAQLLRAQLGTDAEMAAGASAGNLFVLLDGQLQGYALSDTERNLQINWRAGPVSDAIASANYTQQAFTHADRARKPLSPAHIRAARPSGADIEIDWVRRTRVSGDDWTPVEVPLGEAEERYQVDLYDGATLVRTLAATTQAATYTHADQLTDFGSAPDELTIQVAQIGIDGHPGTWGSRLVQL